MHYFLYAQVPGLYVREWERRDPGRVGQPLAIHRDKLVIDVNVAAVAHGLRLGMGVDEAKVLLQGQGLIAWEEEPYRESQCRWLDVLCAFASIVEPDRQDSAWADLSGHPDPFEIARLFTNRLSELGEGEARIGVAGVKWLAKLAAERFGGLAPPAWELAMRGLCEEPEAALAELPIGLLSPVSEVYRERLKFLGYRTIGDVAAIGYRTLRGPFGEEAARIRSAARGGGVEPVRAVYPRDALVAAMRFEGGLEDAEAIGRAVGRLARRLTAGLEARDVYGARVIVRIETESGVRERERTFSRPIRTLREVAAALRLTLGEPGEAVHALAVRLPDLKKPPARQSNLYLAGRSGEDRAAVQAIEGLRGAFGDGAILLASEKAEPRRVRVLRAWRHATGWK